MNIKEVNAHLLKILEESLKCKRSAYADKHGMFRQIWISPEYNLDINLGFINS